MIKMTIEGMMCQHCASRVRKALEALGCKVEIELENKCALISDAAGADDNVAALTFRRNPIPPASITTAGTFSGTTPSFFR